MPLVEHHSVTVWRLEKQRFSELEGQVRIPSERLDEVDVVELTDLSDFEKFPESGGCYWLWTNEPILHRLHKHDLPNPLDGGQIVYNGIAKDNVRARILHHLAGKEDEGWSGISIDIYPREVRSHKKKACAASGKVPYIDREGLPRIRSKELLLELNLSVQEREFVAGSRQDKFYFRNGIVIREKKHSQNLFKAYYITGLQRSLYLEFIEKKWRKDHGLPKLCSYSSGR